MNEMKQDIQKLKKDMADVRATERSIAVALTRIEGKVDGISEQMATQAQLGTLIHQIDDFCRIVEASRGERKMIKRMGPLKTRLGASSRVRAAA